MHPELRTTDIILLPHFADEADMIGKVGWVERRHNENNQDASTYNIVLFPSNHT